MVKGWEFADSNRMCGEREVCRNRCVIVGNLWVERGRGRGRGREGKTEGGRGGERGTEREGEGEEEEEEGGGWVRGGKVLWALGGNLCLAFKVGEVIITLF